MVALPDLDDQENRTMAFVLVVAAGAHEMQGHDELCHLIERARGKRAETKKENVREC
jgi:hypothetical protein